MRLQPYIMYSKSGNEATTAFQSGQNCQQFSWSKLVPISWSNAFFFYGQNSHFCCQYINVQSYKFFLSDHKISWSQKSPFHSNAKISCSTLFHSNLCSTPFQQHFMFSDSLDLPAPDVSHAFLLNFGVV